MLLQYSNDFFIDSHMKQEIAELRQMCFKNVYIGYVLLIGYVSRCFRISMLLYLLFQ